MYNLKCYKSTKGFSLINVIVSLGLLSVLMSGFLAFQNVQYKEFKAINEKLAVQDLEQLLRKVLNNNDVCHYMLTNTTYSPSNPSTFDQSLIGSATPPTISFPGSQFVGTTSANLTTGPFILKVGQPVSAANSNLYVKNIEIRDLMDMGTGNQYKATLAIDFDSTKLVRPVRPLGISIVLNTDNSTPRKITNCNAKDATSVKKSVFTSNSSFTVPEGVDKVYVSMAGGGAGGSGGSWNATDDCGGAGGGGGETKYFVEIATTPGAIIPVTVGAAGAGGGILNSGGIGGSSSFGALSVLGGLPGMNFGGITNQAGAARPGASSGQNGNCAAVTANTHRLGGAGGLTILGLYGAGGSGGYSNNRGGGQGAGGQAGSAGRSGVVIVEW